MIPDQLGAKLAAHTAHSTFVPAPGAEELKARLAALVATPGARFAVLLDVEGFLCEGAGAVPAIAELAAGLALAFANAAAGTGQEFDLGGFRAAVVEYELGALVVQRLAVGGVLAVGIDHPAVLPTLRSRINAALPEFEGALR